MTTKRTQNTTKRTRRNLGHGLYWTPREAYVLRWRVPPDLRDAVGRPYERWIRLDATEKTARQVAAAASADIAAMVRTLRRKGPLPAIIDRINRLSVEAANRYGEQAEAFWASLPKSGEPLPLETVDALLAAQQRVHVEVGAEFDRLLRQAAAAVDDRATKDAKLRRALDEVGGALEAIRTLVNGPSKIEELKLEVAGGEGTATDSTFDREDRFEAFQAAADAREAIAEEERALAASQRALATLLDAAPAAPAPSASESPNAISKIEAKRRIQKALAPSTIPKHEHYLQRWIQIIGDIPVNEVSSVHVRQYRDTLATLPKAQGIAASLRRKTTVSELQAMDGDRLSASSIEKHINWIKALLQFAYEEDLIDDNVARKVKAPKDTRRKVDNDRTFTTEQMIELRDLMERLWKSGSHKQQTYYWIITLCIHLGARVGEVGQLYKDDIRLERGIWCVYFNDRHHNQSLKTDTSLRLIPLPESLIATGFLDWLAKVKTPQIFEAMDIGESEPSGRYGDRASKMLRAQIMSRMKTIVEPATGRRDSRLSCHSLRHRWIQSARRARIDSEHIKAFVGHASKDRVHAGYGGAFDVATLKPSVDLVNVFAD